MGCRKIFLVTFVFILGLVSIGKGEDHSLQHFLSKAASKTIDLSKKERMELLIQIEGLLNRAQGIRAQLIHAIQTGEADVRYQEGKFWMNRLGEDKELIETGLQQIQLLKTKPTQLVASIKLFKSLKDLSTNFNAYNNMPLFSALVGDVAPEMELWADPVFYKLYLLPVAHSKEGDVKMTPPEKKPSSKEKKPSSIEKKPSLKDKKS